MDQPPQMPRDTAVTSDSTEPQTKCRNCRRPLDTSAKFCPLCGARQTRFDTWAYDPLWILVLAFLVLGPFALILVGLSRRMTRTSKAIVSVVILLYTGLVVYYSYKLAMPLIEEFREIGQIQMRL